MFQRTQKSLRKSAIKSLSVLTACLALPLGGVAQADSLPGQIVLFAGECPGGYLPADGSSIDLAAYPELTSVVLNSYGTGEEEGTINLPTADSSAVGRTYNYVYSSDETQSLSSKATSYLVKVRDDRDSLEVVEVVVGNRGGSSDPQAFVRYVTSFEMETGTTVENYAIRTKNGFALPNGQAVSGGEKDSFWFGDYCAGNGNCKNTNKSLITIALSDLKEGDLQGGFPTPPPRQMADDDDANSDVGGESELPEDFAPFQPTYCVAVGGDTAPFVEVGLEYIQGEGKRGSLAFQRIDVSGYRDSELAGLPSNCFKDGNLCLDLLAETNPGISRPNVSFRLVGENVCTAYESAGAEPPSGCGSTSFSWTTGQQFCQLVSPFTTGYAVFDAKGPNGDPLVSCQTFASDEGGTAPDLDGTLCGLLGGTYDKESGSGSAICVGPISGQVSVDNTVNSLDEFCFTAVNSFADDMGMCKPNSGIDLKTYIERCEFAGGAANFDRFGREADVANCAPPFYGTDAGFPDTYCVAQDFGRQTNLGGGSISTRLASASGQFEIVKENLLPYPGELKLSGVQIAETSGYPTAEEWGNHFDAQREALLNGGNPADSPFAYITKRDENNRPGFVAADLVDERTLILENRNTVSGDFFYRVQAQCGSGDDAYNAYYDPLIRTSGKGGTSTY